MPFDPKLSAPSLDPCAVEAELVNALEREDAYGASWVQAGAGTGKTQGTRLWLEKIKKPYAWIQLDPSDEDPLLFLQQLCKAIKPLLRPETQLAQLFPKGIVSPDRHCEFIWDQVVGALQAESVLVLDDAHVIKQWRAHPLLHHILTQQHQRLQIVVLSRACAPQAYAREVVNRQIRLLGPKHLVWGVAQLQRWLLLRWGITTAESDFLEDLLQISQGQAGILALLDILELRRSGASLERAARHIELSSLMEGALLAQLSARDLEILRWLACLGSFPEHWLDDLDIPESVRACIQSWSQSRSVLTRLEHSPGEFRFHPLLCELLKRGTPRLHKADASLRTALIERCALDGRLADALELSRHAQDWRRYWQFLESLGLGWIQKGQLGQLGRCLDAMPQREVERLEGASLSLFRSALLLHQHPAKAYEQGMDAVRRACLSSGGSPEIWALGLETAASSVIAGGQGLALLEEIADEVRKVIGTRSFEQYPSSIRLRALKAGVISSMLADARIPLKPLFSATCAALDASQDIELQADVLSSMMRIVALHGLAELYEPVALRLANLEALATSPTAKTAVLNAKSSQFLALGRRADCVNAAVSTLSGYSEQTPSVWRIEVLCIGTYGCLAGQNLDGARRLCETLEELTKTVEYQSVAHHWHLHAGAIAAHDGDWEASRHHLEQCVHCSDMYGYPFMQIIARSVLLVTALELGMYELAERTLAEGDEILARVHMPLAHNVHEGSKTYFAMATMPAAEARLAYERLFALMERTNNYGLALDLLPQYARFLKFALEHKIRTDLVRAIIARAPAFPKRRPHPDWPSLYEVKVLGGFDLRINGESGRARLTSSGRRFELLTFLLWKGGRGVSHQEFHQYIWPYIEGQKRFKRTMKLALSRLREDLGREDAILDEDEQISLNPELWSYDAWELEAELAKAGPSARLDMLLRLQRGFVGPTALPESVCELVPNRGGMDFGPEPLLTWIELSPDEPGA